MVAAKKDTKDSSAEVKDLKAELEKTSKPEDFIGSQRAYPEAYNLPDCPDERDPLFEEAAYIIVQTQQGSTSMLQRKLNLGYNRAGRIIDQLEKAGIVGPFAGGKQREVRVANEMALEQYLKDLNSEI